MRTFSIITLGFLVFFAFIQTSFAAVLAPDTNWAVSKFGEDAGTETFCAMAKGYSNNTVFTFAHNVKGESSIAVESGALRLLPSKRYKLVMRSGRDYLSSFDIVPVSPKAFVLKVGKDKRLLDALIKNESILISVDSNTLEMNLDDFAEAAAELKSCVGPIEVIKPKPTKKKGGIPGFADYSQKQTSTQSKEKETVSAPEQGQAKMVEAEEQKFIEERRASDASPYALSRPARSARQERLNRQKQATLKEEEAPSSYAPKQEVMEKAPVSIVAQNRLANADLPNSVLVEKLKDENLRLSQALVDQRKKFEQGAIGSVDFNVVRDLTEKVEVLSRENRIMQSKIESDGAGVPFLDMTTELAKMQVREKNLLVQIQEQKQKIADLAQLTTAQQRKSGVVDEAQITALKRQNQKLQEALASVSLQNQAAAQGVTLPAGEGGYTTEKLQSAYAGALQSLRARLSELEQENAQLRSNAPQMALAGRIASVPPAQQPASAPSLSQERTAQWALKKLQRRYEQSEQENKRLGRLLSQARVTQQSRVVAEDLNIPANQPLVPKSLAMNDRSGTARMSASRNKSSVALDMLKQANISLDNGVRKLSDISHTGFNVYQWESNGNFGTIEVTQAVGGAEVLDTLHNAYIEKARRRCQGSFEAIPSDFYSSKGNALAYDVACVDGPNSSAVASLFFLYEDGNFITFAVETTADQFDQAMAIRDKLIKIGS